MYNFFDMYRRGRKDNLFCFFIDDNGDGCEIELVNGEWINKIIITVSVEKVSKQLRHDNIIFEAEYNDQGGSYEKDIQILCRGRNCKARNY